MLKFVDTQVTFAEVPDEISLCINISQCPHHCKGCHSPYLQEDKGTILDRCSLMKLIEANNGITCVCFMGGDADIPYLTTVASFVKNNYSLKTAWYSGLTFIPQSDKPSGSVFDYIKTGPYIEEFGPLTSETTNQRFYAKGHTFKDNDHSPWRFYDITNRFWNGNNS